MGKGKRDKKLSAVATKSDDTKPTPIEVLMRHIVSEYTQTTTVPAGNMTTVPRTGSDGIEYVGLQALCQFFKVAALTTLQTSCFQRVFEKRKLTLVLPISYSI